MRKQSMECELVTLPTIPTKRTLDAFRLLPLAKRKQIAKALALRSLRRFKLARPTVCSVCGENRTLDMHHPNYFHPFLIIWTCKPCHKLAHVNEEPSPLFPFGRHVNAL